MEKSSTIKVVWLGFPQLEAQEFNRILKALDYRPYDIFEIFRNEGHTTAWTDTLLRKQPVDFSLFNGYDALVLTPPAAFYKEILRAYPDAKFVIEDIDSLVYYKRLKRTKRLLGTMFWIRLFKRTGAFLKLIDVDIFAITKGEKTSISAQIAYNDYVADIRRTIPANRLHILEPNKGWQPLCDFLNKPVPNKRFPTQLDSSEMNKAAWQVAMQGVKGNILPLVLYFVTLLSLIVYLIFFYK